MVAVKSHVSNPRQHPTAPSALRVKHKPLGDRKKEMAIVMLRQLFGKFNIDISEDVIDHLIEAAVQTVNTEAGKFGPIVEIGEATVGG
jgi:hypothetical protein